MEKFIVEKLYAIKDENSELYAQVAITKNIWRFLDGLANVLFLETWMIDDHYGGEIKNNDYFCFKKDNIYLVIIMTNERAHIIVIGLHDNKDIKKFINEHYSM